MNQFLLDWDYACNVPCTIHSLLCDAIYREHKSFTTHALDHGYHKTMIMGNMTTLNNWGRIKVVQAPPFHCDLKTKQTHKHWAQPQSSLLWQLMPLWPLFLPQIKTSLRLLQDCLTLWTPFCHKNTFLLAWRKRLIKIYTLFLNISMLQNKST